jgi:hypothetical protein
MSLSLMLSAVALKQAAQGAMRLARESGGERAVGAVAAVLVRHFVDQSQRLTQALARANDRTWRAVELALAGNDWWESTKRRLSRAEDRALAEQIRRYLDQARASAELAALDERTCRAACDELRQARAAGYLHLRDLAPDQLARQTAQFARFDNPLALLRAEAKLIGQIAELLAHAGYPHLGPRVAAPRRRGIAPGPRHAVLFPPRRRGRPRPRPRVELCPTGATAHRARGWLRRPRRSVGDPGATARTDARRGGRGRGPGAGGGAGCGPGAAPPGRASPGDLRGGPAHAAAPGPAAPARAPRRFAVDPQRGRAATGAADHRPLPGHARIGPPQPPGLAQRRRATGVGRGGLRGGPA